MRRRVCNVLMAAILLLVVAPAMPSHAWDHHGHGHGHGHGYWRSPRVVVGIGPAFGWGSYPGYWYYPPTYYPYPYAYWPAPMVHDVPQVYIERPSSAPAGYWYYCESAGEYYPQAPSCPEPWVKVPPVPE